MKKYYKIFKSKSPNFVIKHNKNKSLNKEIKKKDKFIIKRKNKFLIYNNNKKIIFNNSKKYNLNKNTFNKEKKYFNDIDLKENYIDKFILFNNEKKKENIIIINPINILYIKINSSISLENQYNNDILTLYSKNYDIFLIFEKIDDIKIFLKYKNLLKGILIFKTLIKNNNYYDLNLLRNIYFDNNNINVNYLIHFNFNNVNCFENKLNIIKIFNNWKKLFLKKNLINYYFVLNIKFFFNYKKYFNLYFIKNTLNLNKNYYNYITKIFKKKNYRIDSKILYKIINDNIKLKTYTKYKKSHNKINLSDIDLLFEINKRKVNAIKFINSINNNNNKNKIYDFLNRNYNLFSLNYLKLIKLEYNINLRESFISDYDNFKFIDEKIINNKYFFNFFK